MEDTLTVIKDAAVIILIAVTLMRIKRGGDDKWFRIVFLGLLFTL